ncbi:MAG: hypothetical protein JKY37_23240 [Nannocystaceae bacterium]|nr:hypothetical protein [Nannocystaceae bacterium]
MPPPRPARFDVDRAVAWLCSEAIVDANGGVHSWHNRAHPGYVYPEAGGLVLSLLCSDAIAAHERSARAPLADRIASNLLLRAEDDDIGRDGVGYLFDEGIVLAALLRHARQRGAPSSARLLPLYERFTRRLGAREVVDTAAPPRWSSRSGPHLLKLAITIGAWSDVTPRDRSAMAALLTEVDARFDAGRLVTDLDNGCTYVHAHCYGIEGALRLTNEDLTPTKSCRRAHKIARGGAAWLAAIQRASGGIPAWHDGSKGWGIEPADATAQAIRIWALVDRARYADPIERALGFVACLTTPSGAVRYHGESDDENTWATVFAIQAAALAENGGQPAWLI